MAALADNDEVAADRGVWSTGQQRSQAVRSRYLSLPVDLGKRAGPAALPWLGLHLHTRDHWGSVRLFYTIVKAGPAGGLRPPSAGTDSPAILGRYSCE
jgi:hypothetical protein